MNKKENRGITLVALVITIIVLLILAGVSINAIQNGGIVANAKDAKNEYSEQTKKEKDELKNLMDILVANGGIPEEEEGYVLEDGVYGVSIVDGVLNLNGERKYEYQTSLSGKIIVPDGVTKIEGYDGFFGCNKVTEIVLPSSLKTIEGSFGECKLLKKIDLSNTTMEVITGDMFFNCSNLEEIKLPNTVKTIAENAFSNCSSLKSINLPDNITIIKNSAFNGCSNLLSVIIPSKVTTIEYNAFFNCSKLTSVYLPATVSSIGELAFSNCSNSLIVTKAKDSTLAFNSRWGITEAQFQTATE